MTTSFSTSYRYFYSYLSDNLSLNYLGRSGAAGHNQSEYDVPGNLREVLGFYLTGMPSSHLPPNGSEIGIPSIPDPVAVLDLVRPENWHEYMPGAFSSVNLLVKRLCIYTRFING